MVTLVAKLVKAPVQVAGNVVDLFRTPVQARVHTPCRHPGAQGIQRADRARLLEERANRVRPALDDKILASWNGLMLGSFAEAGFALKEQRFLETALAAAGFLWRERCG